MPRRPPSLARGPTSATGGPRRARPWPRERASRAPAWRSGSRSSSGSIRIYNFRRIAIGDRSPCHVGPVHVAVGACRRCVRFSWCRWRPVPHPPALRAASGVQESRWRLAVGFVAVAIFAIECSFRSAWRFVPLSSGLVVRLTFRAFTRPPCARLSWLLGTVGGVRVSSAGT